MYGMAGNKLHWFSSYLKNRQQIVFFQQEPSEFKEVYNGVSKGSTEGNLDRVQRIQFFFIILWLY